MVNITTQHTIMVDPNNGVDHPNCWNETMSCNSLNFALGGVNLDNTIVQLPSGSINLSISNTTISDLSNVTIVGNGTTATAIQCNSTRAGLFFRGMSNLTIANLTISNCSMLQNSTTCNGSSLVQYPSAITIHNSINVTIHSVSFTLNNGIGLSVVNTGGNVTIYGGTFDGNYVTDNDHYPGGGGLYIEFPFCFSDNSPLFNNHLNNNSHYIIDTCYFTNNKAKKMSPPPSYNKTSHDTCICAEQTFGHGGGISVFFRGNSTNNIIDINNTDFVNNTAVWGGGLFVEFHHYANGNKVTIEGYSHFFNNSCTDSDNPDTTVGGGAQIAYAPYDNLISSSYNNVTFSHCNFANNTAYWGGGVSYVIVTERHATGTNSLHFTSCQWQHNQAKFGAAVDLSLYRSLTSGIAQDVVFESCSFVQNKVMFNLQASEFQVHGAGVVYANSITIQLRKKADFTNNTGSALVLSGSYVNVTNGCSVSFVHNRGWRGGALFLLPLSWMVVEENTEILFLKNYADEVGGAVYAEMTNEHNVVSEWNCFIQYSDATLSPDKWNTTIAFQDNKAGHRGLSIYATTIRPCVWGKSYKNVNLNDTKDAFHWKSFTFNGKSGTENFTSDSEIATAANVISVTSETTVTVSPGEEYRLPFTQHDDEGQPAKALLFIQPFANNTESIGRVDNRSVYVYSDIMQVYGNPNTNASFSVTSSGPMPSSIIMNVMFDYCPPGYVGYRKDDVTYCECADSYPNGIPGIVECNSTLSRAYIARLRWGGVYNDGTVEEFVTAVCNKEYCYFNNSDSSRYKMLLPSSRSELDFCSKQNRTGTICGECKPGYSISSRSNCVKCEHGTTKGIFLFILYECLPTLLFVSAILIFNVNITSVHWNSVIFYFQMVENLKLYALQVTSDYSKPVQILIEFHMNVFGIWNLDFFQSIKPEECYVNGMKNAFQFYLLNYATLLFPLVLIFAIIVIKNCNYRLNCCHCCCQENVDVPNNICTKCKQNYKKFTSTWKKWFGETSLIHGLAAFIVLSYTKVALLSMFFFIPGPLYGPGGQVYETRANDVGTLRYLSQEHVAYLFPAFIFLTLAVLFPCYLILKPLLRELFSYYEREDQCASCDAAICCNMVDMGKVDQLLEEFYGPFKKHCRFYAGFFFLYRLAIYATVAFTTSLQTQYCIQQCILVAMLFIHSVLQPYDDKLPRSHQEANNNNAHIINNNNNANNKYKYANVIDALIFLNLNCINALSVYNYYSVIDIQGESEATIAVQLLLVYLPLFYIPLRFIWWLMPVCFIQWFRKTCCKRGNDSELLSILSDVDMEGNRDRMNEMFQDSINVNEYDVI